jgi:hypothetical protein
LLLGSYKASDSAEHFAVRIHPKSESASLPSAWSSILRGLNQFTEFLHRYIENDEASRSVAAALESAFLLTYHRNAYIYALVEACQAGRKIAPAALERIGSSLAASAPSVASDLRRSAKVAIIEGLNASPLRGQVPRLWSAYCRLKSRAR